MTGPRRVRAAVVGLAIAAALLLVAVTVDSTAWLGRTFPGFFVMVNRVVPSVALPSWAGGEPTRLFQHEIVAVDGVAVGDAEAVYALVGARPPATPIAYTLRSRRGERTTVIVPSRVFTAADWLLLFGAFLLVGTAFLATGLWVAWAKPDSPASMGLLVSGVVGGTFALTAVDLYGPWHFVRVHVLAEALLAAAFAHLAAVFPTEHFGRYRRAILTGLYAAFGVFALAYEVALDRPAAYTVAHLVATAAHGAGALAVIVAVGWDWAATPSPLVRRRIGVVALGTLAGFVAPALTMASSAWFGGQIPVNVGALTAVCFPVSLGYAVVKRDLFEIDVMLRRATTYGIVVVAIGGVYFTVLSLAGAVLPEAVRSPLGLGILNLVLLFGMWPVQRRVQETVDQVFFRRGYDPQTALAELSHALVLAHTVEHVLAETRRMLAATVAPTSWTLFACEAEATLRWTAGTRGPEILQLPPDLAARAAAGQILTRYEWEDGSQPVPALWRDLDAALLIPIRSLGPMVAMLALGPKASGRPYTMHDGAFLRAVASQVALAMANANSFARLQDLNASLEAQVRDRTADLKTANLELNRSLTELQHAYGQLERSQASLVRADRLATLGRLAAGIAHEVNTPLAAVQNALKVLQRLGDEYDASIDDPSVTPTDHHAIAADVRRTAESAAGWARKAAAFIAKVKLHSRDPGDTSAHPFSVADVLTESSALLAHRVRAADCRLDVRTEGDMTLVGEATRLGQVIVNLIGNALDAYEDHAIADGWIEAAAWRTHDAITITVRDRAGGIPADVLPRIFDELFTTKEPGRGTGLGLWIARTLVEERFGGTLAVETVEGTGTAFTMVLPLAGRRTVPASAA